MHLFISPTDHDWYTFLRDRRADEVNFWRPGGTKNFNALARGESFLFKAKAPYNAIIGGGLFAGFTRVPISMAWQAFGEFNGTPDIVTFLQRVRKYRPHDHSPDPDVGCILLSEPFFFPEELWVGQPGDWSRQIVSGKLYNTDDAIGAALWDAIVARLADPRTIMGPAHTATTDRRTDSPASPHVNQYGSPYVIAPRLGQGTFRLGVLDAYQRRCAVTGDRIIPVLEAAHIRPYASQGPHEIPNGLLLRSDIHRLFDLGYVTITPTYEFRVSSRLEHEFHNGRNYYELSGRKLATLPDDPDNRPAVEYLEWHNDAIFQPGRQNSNPSTPSRAPD